jgi:hypothetical protein
MDQHDTYFTLVLVAFSELVAQTVSTLEVRFALVVIY